MKQFNFDTPEDFESFFSGRNLEVADAITEGIKVAVKAKKKNADLFEVAFDGDDNYFEIGLPLSEWPVALNNCLNHYQEAERYDDAIDTFQLLKEVTELF
jgi:hypothetical protein